MIKRNLTELFAFSGNITAGLASLTIEHFTAVLNFLVALIALFFLLKKNLTQEDKKNILKWFRTFLKLPALLLAALLFTACSSAPRVLERQQENLTIQDRIIKPPAIRAEIPVIEKTPQIITGQIRKRSGKDSVIIKYYPLQDRFTLDIQPADITLKDTTLIIYKTEFKELEQKRSFPYFEILTAAAIAFILFRKK